MQEVKKILDEMLGESIEITQELLNTTNGKKSMSTYIALMVVLKLRQHKLKNDAYDDLFFDTTHDLAVDMSTMIANKIIQLEEK